MKEIASGSFLTLANYASVSEFRRDTKNTKAKYEELFCEADAGGRGRLLQYNAKLNKKVSALALWEIASGSFLALANYGSATEFRSNTNNTKKNTKKLFCEARRKRAMAEPDTKSFYELLERQQLTSYLCCEKYRNEKYRNDKNKHL